MGYEVECCAPRRACGSAVACSLLGPLGLEAGEASLARSQRCCASIRGRCRCGVCPGPLRTQTFVGNYVSPCVGEGLEPGDIRPFAPGDRDPPRQLARLAAAWHAPRHAATTGSATPTSC